MSSSTPPSPPLPNDPTAQVADAMHAAILSSSGATWRRKKCLAFAQRTEAAMPQILAAAAVSDPAQIGAVARIFREAAAFMEGFGPGTKNWRRIFNHGAHDRTFVTFYERLDAGLASLHVSVAALAADQAAQAADAEEDKKELRARIAELREAVGTTEAEKSELYQLYKELKEEEGEEEEKEAGGAGEGGGASAAQQDDGTADMLRLEDGYDFDGKRKDAAKGGCRLGKGAFGVTYRMLRKSDGRPVAAKAVNMDDAEGAGVNMAQVRGEGRALMALRHPNIIGFHEFCLWVHEVDEDMVREWVVIMEYAPGGTLALRVASGEQLSEESVTKTGLQLCSALHHMHVECRMIHRDLKPENVLLSENGDVKICDLGLATIVQTGASMSKGKGTLTYLSPEKGRGERYGEKDDIWALGCIIFELVTGVPTSSLSPAGLFNAQQKIESEVVGAVEAIYPRFSAAVRAMLREDPAERPAAADVGRMIEANGDAAASAAALLAEQREQITRLEVAAGEAAAAAAAAVAAARKQAAQAEAAVEAARAEGRASAKAEADAAAAKAAAEDRKRQLAQKEQQAQQAEELRRAAERATAEAAAKAKADAEVAAVAAAAAQKEAAEAEPVRRVRARVEAALAEIKGGAKIIS